MSKRGPKPFKVDPNKTYTVSGPVPRQILFFDEAGNEVGRISAKGMETTFTVPKECTSLKLAGWARHSGDILKGG